MMDGFEYACPETLPEVCEILDDYNGNVTILAGGQSLLPQLRQRITDYDCVVDVNGLSDGAYIETDAERITVGILTRYRDVVASDAVEKHCKILHEAVAGIGDKQVRNRGTICGSIAHADPAGDPPVIATALDADIVATSSDGRQTYDAGTFFEGFYETALDDREIVTEVRFSTVGSSEGGAYETYEPSEGAYPVATVAAIVSLANGQITDATIVTGAIEDGPTPMAAAEELLIDAEPTEDVVREAAQSVGDGADPIEDAEGSVEFKREITKTLAKRALNEAITRARGKP